MRSDIRRGATSVLVVATLVTTVVAAGVDAPWRRPRRPPAATERPLPEPIEPPEELLDVERIPMPDGATLDLGWLRVVAVVLLVALVAFAAWWLWSWWRQRPAPRRVRPQGVVAAPQIVTEPELPVLQRGVEDAQRYLERIAAPMDAVIAAWSALEEAAAASRVSRAASQTPTEFTVAVLARTDADPDATNALLALYHRARFSDEAIGPDDVARASRCLATLAAGWSAVTASDGARS